MNRQYFSMMAAYNRWANRILFDAAAELSAEEFTRDVSAFFRSMMGTLNHLLVTDRIWMQRFTGEGEAPKQLDAILHEGFEELRAARVAEDERICAWVDGLSDERLAESFTYRHIADPTPITQRLAPALAHMFNHQTHHRGQAHMCLSVLGKNPPQLDIIYFLRSADGAQFA